MISPTSSYTNPATNQSVIASPYSIRLIEDTTEDSETFEYVQQTGDQSIFNHSKGMDAKNNKTFDVQLRVDSLTQSDDNLLILPQNLNTTQTTGAQNTSTALGSTGPMMSIKESE